MTLKSGYLHKSEVLVADEQHDDLLTGNTGCILIDTALFWCAGHGIYLAGESPVAGSYRQA